MIDESIKIKLNQFMLAYERQCVEVEFQKQNIKQNVMLSIIENKNAKKNSLSTINNSLEKSMVKSKVHQNLTNSKQSKFSEHKETPDNNKYSDPNNNNGYDNYPDEMQNSNLKSNSSSSRLLERSNILSRENRSNLIRNNYVEKNYDEKIEQQQNQQKTERSRKSGLYNNPYYKQKTKQSEIQALEQDRQQTEKSQFQKSYMRDVVVGSKKVDNFFENDKKMIESQLKDQDNLVESAISRRNQGERNQRRGQKQMDEGCSGGELQSGAFGKRSLLGSKVYGQSQKVIGKQSNPSLVGRQQQHCSQQEINQQQQLQNYPTFKKPSFQFITNVSQLRQSNPHTQQQQQQQSDMKEQQQAKDYSQYYPQQRKMHNKWNQNASKDEGEDWGQQEDQQQQQYEEEQQYQQEDYSGKENFSKSGQKQSIISRTNNPSSVISNIKQDQSMLIPSQFKQKPTQQSTRKSYLAFQINMQKSTLPNNQNIEQLKKKKILQLQRKRMQRIENNSRKKLNPSQVNTPTSKQHQKQLSSPFIGSSRHSQRKQTQNNRDSLNKSINERKQQRAKFMKTTNSSYRQEQIAHKDSMFHDNRTIITKYGDESRMTNNNNNRSASPLNTVKTTHMNTNDKRPPLNKNRRQENIFAAETGFQRDKGQSGYQRQRSAHKVSDPKIVPIDRKNSFQKKSNIKLMANAITYTCLPGELNRREREKLIDILDDYESEFFIFLFKEYSRKVIKGIYILQSGYDRIVRIYGQKAPLEIFQQQIQQFYRFDSGSRQFKKIDGCKSFSFSVHAIDLK